MSPRVGDELPPWSLESVGAGPMARFAVLLADPNPIHLDPDAVRALGMGDRVVNQGPLNLAYLQNMLIGYAGGPDRIRELRLRFAANVFAGDRVVAGGRVTAVPGPAGPAGEQPVECEVWLDAFRPGDPGPVRVLSGTALVSVGGGTVDTAAPADQS